MSGNLKVNKVRNVKKNLKLLNIIGTAFNVQSTRELEPSSVFIILSLVKQIIEKIPSILLSYD